MNMFRNCAYESNQFKFHQKLYLLLKEGSDPIRKFLQTWKRENWTSSYFEGQKYGEMYSNVAESFNSWIREGRHLPIMELVDYIRGQIMKMMADRREIGNRWNGGLCPEIDNRIANLLKEGRCWRVTKASEFVFEVHSQDSVMVDLLKRTCSCCEYQVNGFLCAHAAVAIQKSGMDLNRFIDKFFSKEYFVQSYREVIYPVPTFERDDESDIEIIISPPSAKRMAGRPRKKRIASRGEEKREFKCGTCRKVGHNRKSCPENL